MRSSGWSNSASCAGNARDPLTFAMPSPLSELSANHPFVVRIVLVNTYARGLQPWIEREKLQSPLPLGPFAVIYANDHGVVGLITGMGAINETASTLSFGFNARFDLRQAYWLIAGLGGIDPEDASLASAVWSKWIADGVPGARNRRAGTARGLGHRSPALQYHRAVHPAARASRHRLRRSRGVRT